MPDAEPIMHTCASCRKPSDVSLYEPFSNVACPYCSAAMRIRRTFHHFSITRQLGSGGMSRVFQAHDVSLRRDVALKILNRECGGDRGRLAQFEKEAEITARIQHPNVVRVFSAARDKGCFYIAMELVSGGSLEEMLRIETKLPESRLLDMAVQMTLGLRAAHEAGLVHRDLKPGNILFSADGIPKIVDFGLAMFARDADGRGEIWATPFYVPLEILNHAPEDFRSDIYSIAATWYHALLGHPPCRKETATLDELKKLKSRPILLNPVRSGISPETCALLTRALACRKENRHRSYDELLEQLARAQRRLKIVNAGSPPVSKERFKWQRWGAAALIVATGAGVWKATRPFEAQALTGNAGNAASFAVNADHTDDFDQSVSVRFLTAREAMLQSDFTKALRYFEELNSSSTRQPTRNWALVNAGICALLKDDLVDARTHFVDLEKHSSAVDDPLLGKFFAHVGNVMAGDGPVSIDELKVFPTESVQAVGLLMAGLKNWVLGDAASAHTFWEAFSSMQPPRSARWLESYRGLITVHRVDAAALNGIRELDISTLSNETARIVVAAARAKLERVTLDSPAKRKATAMVDHWYLTQERREQKEPKNAVQPSTEGTGEDTAKPKKAA